jgi:hypothetical protein
MLDPVCMLRGVVLTVADTLRTIAAVSIRCSKLLPIASRAAVH